MIKIIQFISFLLILYIFLISDNINTLFQSILGRLFIFLFLILITHINKILGIIFACYLLLSFNNELVSNYIPFHNQQVENFSNIYSDNDTKSNKIIMEKYLQPKKSNDLFPFIIKLSNKEPKPYF
jgi:hypothetical protein